MLLVANASRVRRLPVLIENHKDPEIHHLCQVSRILAVDGMAWLSRRGHETSNITLANTQQTHLIENQC